MEYDPEQFQGTAPYYLLGRPPYSAELQDVLSTEVGFDGDGRLLDVGSGPGTLGVQLAPMFRHVTFLEPDGELLAEARRHADAQRLTAVDFLHATAEDIPSLHLGPLRAASFGQSFHRMERIRVAEAVYDVLQPGGSLLSISHDARRPPRGRPPGVPAIPYQEIETLITSFLGSQRRSGNRPTASYLGEPEQETLARTRFGSARAVYARGRTDIVRDVDGVIARYLSMSYCAPHLFGSSLDEFTAAFSGLLTRLSPEGQFWDWPGDTQILIATRTP